MTSRRGGRRTHGNHGIGRIAPSTELNSESSASMERRDPSRIIMESENAAEPQLTSNGSTTNTNTGENSRVRGITCGKGARKAMAKAKGRLRVEFDFRAGKAICANAECFNNEIGIIVRSDCGLQYKEWRCVPKFVREPLRAKLLGMFDIDIDDEEVQKVIDFQMAKAWRTFKYKLHTHFTGLKEDEDPKENCPDEVTQEEWDYLCDRWADDAYKERAKKNAEARGKRKHDSKNGSRSTVRHHVARGLELDAPTGHIETWKHCHHSSEKGWSSQESEAIYKEMLQLRQENPAEEMTDKVIMEKVLGRHSNRLCGWGRSPSKSQKTTHNEGSSRPTYAQALAELEKVKENNAEANRELEALKDDVSMLRQQLIDANILPRTSAIRAPSDSSRGGTSPTGRHGFLFD